MLLLRRVLREVYRSLHQPTRKPAPIWIVVRYYRSEKVFMLRRARVPLSREEKQKEETLWFAARRRAEAEGHRPSTHDTRQVHFRYLQPPSK